MKATREDGRGYPGYIFKRGRIGSGNGPLNLREAAPREDRSFLSRIHGLFDSRPTMRRLVRGHITDIVRSGRLSRVYEEREREREEIKWILLISFRYPFFIRLVPRRVNIKWLDTIVRSVEKITRNQLYRRLNVVFAIGKLNGGIDATKNLSVDRTMIRTWSVDVTSVVEKLSGV